MSEEGGVFCAWPPTKLTMDDVRNALEICKSMRERDARNYMLSYGMDYDRVHKYWDIVCKFEELYQRGRQDERVEFAVKQFGVMVRTAVAILLSRGGDI